MRGIINTGQKDELDKFFNSTLLSGIDDARKFSYSTRFDDYDFNSSSSPLMVDSEFYSNSLVEKAGESYIFSIGKIIGTQSELYQENDRVNNIEFVHPMHYNHVITLNIPSNYELGGLQDLNIDHKVISENRVSASFKSSYIIENNQLIISIEEIYATMTIPKSDYEGFRKVINSAADFSKVSILLKKSQH